MAILKVPYNGEWAIIESPSAIKFTEQSLTESEKAQARANIGVEAAPVQSVNGQTGVVELTPADIGALPDDTVIPTVPTKISAFTNDVGYLTEHQSLAGYVTEQMLTTHNISTSAHNDIRLLVEGLGTRLNALADSDDTTLDQMSEIVAYIKSNKSLIDNITTNKVNVSDIINNLTTNVTNKPLSAAQGVALKALIDAKLDATALDSAIDDALAQAKASGEFKGDTGVGVSSVRQTTTSAADDGNNIITVTLTDGTTSTFTVQNGSKGSSPVRGTDYWTAADKAEIKAYVDEAILGGEW